MSRVLAKEKGSQALVVILGWRPAIVKPLPFFPVPNSETGQVGGGRQHVGVSRCLPRARGLANGSSRELHTDPVTLATG